MRVLDLFAGLGGWSTPFKERGHEVVTVDNQERFGCTYTADLLEWEPEGDFDIVLASPPCESFSVLTIGHNWTGPLALPPHQPKTDSARVALRLVEQTVGLIEQIQPAFFVIENPRAKLRKLPVVADLERRTVTYCQFGERFMKPTDLWGGFPPSLTLPRPCSAGDPCHVRAPRGSRTGIQGHGVLTALREPSPEALEQDELERRWTRPNNLESNKRVLRSIHGTSNMADLAALRAKIPEQLALDVCLAAERDLAAGRVAADYTGRLFA